MSWAVVSPVFRHLVANAFKTDLDSFHRHGSQVVAASVKLHQAILYEASTRPRPPHEIEFDIKIRVFVLLIEAAAVPCDLLNLRFGPGGSLFIRGDGILGRAVPP